MATETDVEEILSTEPFKAQYTYTMDGDTLVLTVDDDLSVVDVTRQDVSESNC